MRKGDEKRKPKIIEARNDTEDITNKIKAIIGMKWDNDINNDGDGKVSGGLNLREILEVYPSLETSVIWITYIFEIEKKISEMSDEELGKNIKHLLIDFGDKSMYRTSDLKEKEPAIFGEVAF